MKDFSMNVFFRAVQLISLAMASNIIYAENIITQTGLNDFQKQLIKHNQASIIKLLAKDNISGAAIALVDKKGIIWAQGFGGKGDKGGNAIGVKTLFSIESQTKMFTTLGVLRAVQKGELSLNKPIVRYLPRLKVYSVFQTNPGNLITLKELLSHSAGFAHEAPIGNNFGSNANFQTHMNSILAGTWLQFPAGTGYNYSNVGIDLAGYILQQRTKIPFSKYMEENVLLPLGMKDSTYDLSKFLNSKNHAPGVIEGLSNVPDNHSIIPAGGMYSNVMDMSHYLMFQLNNGVYNNKRLLRKTLINTMLTIPFPNPGQTDGNGLGIWKGTRNNTIFYSHLGRGFGFADNLEWYPQYNIGVVVLTNKYDMNNTDIKISHLIIDPIIKHQRQQKLKIIMPNMLGSYISNSQNIIISNKNNHIFLKGIVNWGPAGNNMTKSAYKLKYIGSNMFVSTNKHEKFKFYLKGITGVPTLERIDDGYMWYVNEPTHSVPGPNKSLWKQYVGIYYLHGYGQPLKQIVKIKNGYLYIDAIRLRQMRSNVFAAPNGEMLVFNSNNASWGNLTLLKNDTRGDL